MEDGGKSEDEFEKPLRGDAVASREHVHENVTLSFPSIMRGSASRRMTRCPSLLLSTYVLPLFELRSLEDYRAIGCAVTHVRLRRASRMTPPANPCLALGFETRPYLSSTAQLQVESIRAA